MNLEKFVEKNAPRNRIALLVIVDIFLIALSGFLALYIRYDFRFSNMEMRYVDYELLYLWLRFWCSFCSSSTAASGGLPALRSF